MSMADLDKKRTSHNRQAKGVSRERERDSGGDGKSGRKKAFVTKHRKICAKWRQAEKATTQAIVDTVECVCVCMYLIQIVQLICMCTLG